ncbi:MAG: UMP kinase [Nanoarchaeota archaeon]
MQKKVIVLSLGGSLIVPEKIDVSYLKKFREIIRKNSRKYKFIIVCGGGSVARKYISALRETGINETLQSMVGISATRTNARFMSYFFNQNPWKGIPQKMEEIHKYLKSQDIVFCGALEYKPNQTSDSTSAQIAEHFKTDFINLTNVSGLYDKNPKEYKNAKFIPEISWKDFDKMANKIKYKPGQHFVLDQTASKIIMKNKITTYIIGQDIKQLDNLLNGRKFSGTRING